MTEVLLDTSALVEFFDGSDLGVLPCDAIEHAEAAISVLSLAELSSVCATRKISAKEQLAFLQNNVTILPVTKTVCEQAGEFRASQRSKNRKTSLIDAIIYLTAREQNIMLLTKDQDFADLDGVRLL